MKYIFYSVIGKHAHESIDYIIKNKIRDIEKYKFSLWAAQIDQKSIDEVWKLDKSAKIFVLCKISSRAKDPAKNTGIKRATKMILPMGVNKSIPEDMEITYSQRSKYQAYVVKKVEILKEPILFDFGQYETYQRNNIIKSFKENFQTNTRFQNRLGIKNEEKSEVYKKEVSVIIELEYPFVVQII